MKLEWTSVCVSPACIAWRLLLFPPRWTASRISDHTTAHNFTVHGPWKLFKRDDGVGWFSSQRVWRRFCSAECSLAGAPWSTCWRRTGCSPTFVQSTLHTTLLACQMNRTEVMSWIGPTWSQSGAEWRVRNRTRCCHYASRSQLQRCTAQPVWQGLSVTSLEPGQPDWSAGAYESGWWVS